MDMSAPQIKEVVSKADLRGFITLPYRLYRGDSVYVPPLRGDVKKQLTGHPFFKDAFVRHYIAHSNGTVVGRISAIVDHTFNRFQSLNAGFFGYFECVEEPDCANALLDTCFDALRKEGVTTVFGPASPNSNGEYGLLIKGFDLMPSVLMPYHKPYYQRFFEDYGLEKGKDLLAYEVAEERLDPRTMNLLERILKRQKSVHIREIELSRFGEEVETMCRLYNSVWEKNWGFSPMSAEAFRFEARQLRKIVDPRVVLIAEIDGDAAAFALSVPNINEALRHAGGRLLPFGLFKILYYARKIKSLRTILLGVLPKYRDRGLDAALYFETIRRGLKAGYDRSECSWLLEDNEAIIKPMRKIGGEVTKVYRVYETSV